MMSSRYLKLSLLRGLFTTSSATPIPHQSRLYPVRNLHSRAYSNGTHNKSDRLSRKLSEDDESNPFSLAYYAVPPALLVIAGLVTYIHYNDEKRAIPIDSQQTNLPKRCTTNRPAIGGPFKLYDTEKNEVTESNLRGKWTLMYFGYTSCPDVGPNEVKKMAEVTSILESKYNFKVKPVFITIDPQRDTPAQLKTYLKEFDPRIIGLTGSIAAVRQVAQEYRVFFKKVDEVGQDYLVDCSHQMHLLDPSLETARSFGIEYDAPQVADAVMVEIQKSSK